MWGRAARRPSAGVGAMLDNITSVTNSVFVGTVITADLLDNI